MVVSVNGNEMQLPEGLNVDGLLDHLKVKR